jgi:hypothetical protein
VLVRRVGWQPSRFLSDRGEAERAFQLAERLGSVRTGETPSSAGPFLPKGDFVTEPRDLTDADRLHISLGQRVRERVAVDRRGAGSVTRAPQGRSAAAAQALPGPRRDGLSSCARILRAPTGKLVPRPGAYRLAPIVPTVPARRDGAPP